MADFEWDEEKSIRNRRERGLPFELAMALFDGNVFERADQRFDYGEQRIQAIGEIGGRVMVCIYTWRVRNGLPVRRVISFRKANEREVDAYRQKIQG